MTDKLLPKKTYSARDLASFKLPGFPTAKKAWHAYARRLNWESVFIPDSGRGCKNGLREEFVPPEDVQLVIDALIPNVDRNPELKVMQQKELYKAYEETFQYDEFKVYRDNVVKLNAKPKMWLEDIVNYFVSLPEQEQEKISIYSKDLYDKVTNLEKRKQLNVTISGIVEVPVPDNRGNANESIKFKSQRRQNFKHSKLYKR